jgi:hypothetical protein
MGGISDVLGAVGGIASAFGGPGNETGSPSTSSSDQSSLSGYAALPPQGQQAYNSYFNLINGLYGASQPNSTPYQSVSNPTSPFQSQGVYQLQQATGSPVLPVGRVEPLNSYQTNALTQLGNPNYGAGNMAQYENPFNQQVADTTQQAIARQGAINNSSIQDQHSLLNSSAMSSSLGTELAQNNYNTDMAQGQAAANLGYQGYNSSIGLMNQSLQNQLASGSAIQGQNQNLLNTTNPAYAYTNTPAYLQASLLSPLFGSFPSSSSSTGSSTSTGSTITPNSFQASPASQLGGAISSIGDLFDF